jgi:hypothetical protein
MDWADSPCYKNSPAHFQSDTNSEPNNEPNRYPHANGHASPRRHFNPHRYPPATTAY